MCMDCYTGMRTEIIRTVCEHKYGHVYGHLLTRIHSHVAEPSAWPWVQSSQVFGHAWLYLPGCICLHVNGQAFVQENAHARLACEHICMQAWIHACMYACMAASMHGIDTCTRMCVCTCTYSHTHTCVHTYACTLICTPVCTMHVRVHAWAYLQMHV